MSRVEYWLWDKAARLPPWATPLPAPRWPWSPPREPAWPAVRRNQRKRIREEFERHRIHLSELCRVVRVGTMADLQQLRRAMVLPECVYKVP
jgi:hypothetical protein